ncbi:MAG TPA: cellulase N-terminal Ig-like domain-containing protein, partial [Sedimentisphaerales bacterium]|nr:cellulase N-terminal Ig-like domain-containing protein [Sedimentisphaerales bacterium]
MRIRPAVVVLLFCANGVLAADSDIRLNSLGFLPKLAKKASIVAPCSEFMVKRASGGETVFTGKATGPIHQDDVKQDVWIADFSSVNAKGKFYLDVPGVGRSIDFEIGDAVYDFAYRTAMRAFYLW